jgi:hypothetical protein
VLVGVAVDSGEGEATEVYRFTVAGDPAGHGLNHGAARIGEMRVMNVSSSC